ncbi:MAG: hypothetical protein LBU50_06070 [Cellulomonas sp.]|nr:hypothetical protein [Cellulomonas sp.]
MNDTDAPTVRYNLTADQLRLLEDAWGGRLPDDFHFEWSDAVAQTDRDRRDTTARDALRDGGLLEPGPDGSVERHVRRFLDVLRRPTAVVTVRAWTRRRQWLEQVWCDAQWGISLLRAQVPSPGTTDPPPGDGDRQLPWADEDAIRLSLAQRGTALAEPLDLFEQVREPSGERTVAVEPIVLNLAESVAVVAACRPDRSPEVAYELLRQVGADRSGEPFHSLAGGIDAGFEVVVAAPDAPARHGLYVRARGLWVSLGARIDSVGAQVAAGLEPPTGQALADATAVRLAVVTAGTVVADYLTSVTDLQEGTP